MMPVFSVTSTKVTYTSVICNDRILQHLKQVEVRVTCKALGKIRPIGFCSLQLLVAEAGISH